MQRKTHKQFLKHIFYNDEPPQIEEEEYISKNPHKQFKDFLTEKKNPLIGDNVFEVIVKLSVDKRKTNIQALITNLLTDIRAITRVTVVSSLKTKTTETKKLVTAKIKFNTKNLYYEGFNKPEQFVNKLLIPTIQKLDEFPKVLSISKVEDHITNK